MKKVLMCLALLIAATQITNAQNRYIIQLTDKATNPYSLSNPSAYLSERAIARRVRYSIQLDSTDLPVTPRYIDSIRSVAGVSILNISKWLNSVSIYTIDAAALARINSFSFVQNATPIAARIAHTNREKFEDAMVASQAGQRQMGTSGNYYSYGNSRAQIELHNGSFLHDIGLRGEGMLIGMLDAGYNRYLTLKAFDSVIADQRILETWDFVALETSVIEDNPHGMQCFSIIAANMPGQFVGAAPKANFLLYRSEDASSEYPIEEHNWVCAAERVDSSGGDVISSSLGYYVFDAPLTQKSYTYADMNGNTTTAAIGADLAAKKGILVVNAAGNEGDNSWGKIITPADGDSVLAVGAVRRDSVPASFTSRGPSSDGRVKPDVVSVGVASTIQLTNNTIGTSNGTSFAAPNMAGLVTCLWQGFPEVSNMQIIQALKKSGNRFKNPNDTLGYGIPDMKKAVMFLLKDFATASASFANCKTVINWQSKDVSSMKYEIERKLPGQTSFVKIAEQQGTGAAFSPHEYSFTDDVNNAPAGMISYRIKQVIDTVSTTLFADVIDSFEIQSTVQCGLQLPNNDIAILPNPSRNQFTVRITSEQPIERLTIRMFDMKGQLVLSKNSNKQSGTTLINLPVFQLAAGKYLICVYNQDQLLGTREAIKL
jgi:hypothetical protein